MQSVLDKVCKERKKSDWRWMMFRCLLRLSQRSAGFANLPGVAEVAQLWSLTLGERKGGAGGWGCRGGGRPARTDRLSDLSFNSVWKEEVKPRSWLPMRGNRKRTRTHSESVSQPSSSSSSSSISIIRQNTQEIISIHSWFEMYAKRWL